MNPQEAKSLLDRLIAKARVHLYKPIQIAEILHRDRTVGDVNLQDLESYRTVSRKWRDVVCVRFLGRSSTSSARYQDDLFNDNAIPPSVLSVLGSENRRTKGSVEAYIYHCFRERFSQLLGGLSYAYASDRTTFELEQFLSLFWSEPGLRRSIDKVYEIIVHSLFSALTEALELTVEVSINPEKSAILAEFEDFALRVVNLSSERLSYRTSARVHRVGVTNAADRGLDMWANFGLAIQIKHLSLSEELAEDIVGSVSADRIVIVCKQAEEKTIVSLLNQIGWKSRIQSIITETDLSAWYERGLRGKYGDLIGERILMLLRSEIESEFPVTESSDFEQFYRERGYDRLVKRENTLL